MTESLRLRKLPPLGDLPRLGNPTKGYVDDDKPKSKGKNRGRSRSACRSRK